MSDYKVLIQVNSHLKLNITGYHFC